MMVAADRRHHEDRVRFFSVQRSMRDIGDREVLDHIAALQFEIADPIELMWRLIRSVRQCDAVISDTRQASAASNPDT